MLGAQLDYFPDARLGDIDSKKEVFEGQPSNLYSRFEETEDFAINIRYYIKQRATIRKEFRKNKELSKS